MKTKTKFVAALNGIIVLLLCLAVVYVPYGSLLEPERWRRAEDVVRMFSDCFTREQPLYSLFNNCSEILWVSAASVCLFSWCILRKLQKSRAVQRFMLYSFALLSIWMIDDLFRITLILNLFLGLPKALSYFVYVLLFASYGMKFRRHLLKTPYYLFGISALLLTCSNAIDLVSLPGENLSTFLEEGMKLIGLVNLALYYWMISYDAIAKEGAK